MRDTQRQSRLTRCQYWCVVGLADVWAHVNGGDERVNSCPRVCDRAPAAGVGGSRPGLILWATSYSHVFRNFVFARS